ncbi:MAG: cytochrome c [Chitinophagaceae bacterium]|nr:MAG: cytochrome c [Chitinophagaceae bacterium]
MKKLLFISSLVSLVLFTYSCNDDKPGAEPTGDTPATELAKDNSTYDAKRGAGKFTKVEIPATLDAAMAEKGNQVFTVKCSPCHKLTDEKLVGPGWKGVTTRRTPEWIMNFITNTEEMLTKDPEVQAQLEICLVRMPNQNVSDEDARAVYEFQRKNDGVK